MIGLFKYAVSSIFHFSSFLSFDFKSQLVLLMKPKFYLKKDMQFPLKQIQTPWSKIISIS